MCHQRRASDVDLSFDFSVLWSIVMLVVAESPIGETADMARAIALLLLLPLATATAARADDHGPRPRFHLGTFELLDTFTARAPSAAKTSDPIDNGSVLEHLDKRAVGLPPLFTLVTPDPSISAENAEAKPPMFAFGARVQGRTLVAFTRPGTKVDPDDKVVYQRLVVSDLFEGRRFSVTVFEDHVLGSSTQVLGFGARMMLRPAIDVGGWRARVELFASYDMTEGAVGYLGITARSPLPPPPATRVR
jgi:hypothetical protein